MVQLAAPARLGAGRFGCVLHRATHGVVGLRDRVAVAALGTVADVYRLVAFGQSAQRCAEGVPCRRIGSTLPVGRLLKRLYPLRLAFGLPGLNFRSRTVV